MKPCPECGCKDYTYQQDNKEYFLICTNCGYHAERENAQLLENHEESIETIEDDHDRTGDTVP
jgi:DNA-directed RNA polymerase subunit M/transcription elongation factor TFIIS